MGRRKKGKKALDAIIEATSVRFRPIVMTNLALIVGMLPIALGSGAGAEWKKRTWLGTYWRFGKLYVTFVYHCASALCNI